MNAGENPAILILGGCEIAYQLAQKLQILPLTIISSLAGRTQNPRIPAGTYRIGGFGGVKGLVKFLKINNIKLIIDATHPFARKIQENARMASLSSAIPLLRLQQPLWQQQTGDQWIKVKDETEACSLLPTGSTIFLALGRQYLQNFSPRRDIHFIARMLEKPDYLVSFSKFKIIISPPTTIKDEIDLFKNEKIDFLVCRNSGAQASYAKIIAARQLKIPIFMIMPTNSTHAFTSIEEVFDIILSHFPKISLNNSIKNEPSHPLPQIHKHY